ncbi:MAG TPA: hypothetical protein PLH98_14435 [Ruminococcus flavefaciens]|jgi:hypothetical protein|nr:hypothetical protein [Ruminococcus flavefaciens]
MSDGFKFNPANMPQIDLLTTNHLANSIADSFAERNREMERTMQAIQDERERKESNEEAYRQETIRSLHAIEQNTANLYTLVDLINKSNEQQDELIAIIADILTIAKAKDKKEAESIYKKVMAKITQTVKDGETLAKVVGYATTVYELAKPIIENLKV